MRSGTDVRWESLGRNSGKGSVQATRVLSYFQPWDPTISQQEKYLSVTYTKSNKDGMTCTMRRHQLRCHIISSEIGISLALLFKTVMVRELTVKALLLACAQFNSSKCRKKVLRIVHVQSETRWRRNWRTVERVWDRKVHWTWMSLMKLFEFIFI